LLLFNIFDIIKKMNKERIQSVLANKTAANSIAVFGSFAFLIVIVAVYNFSVAGYFLAGLSGFEPEEASPQLYSPITTEISIVIQPSGLGCVADSLAIQPVVAVKDQYGKNMPDGSLVKAAIAGGIGKLTGTTTVEIKNGLAEFSDLGYDTAGQTFYISFKSGNYSVSSDAVGPLLKDCD
jgi:hypothetical protein